MFTNSNSIKNILIILQQCYYVRLTVFFFFFLRRTSINILINLYDQLQQYKKTLLLEPQLLHLFAHKTIKRPK